MTEDVLRSDTAGRVLEILKTPGDAVAAGETVATIEAMKMEIPVASPAAGTLRAIHVALDDMIEEDQPLATLERAE
ncbi:acetyl-CoA carboxylase biotin carboxyl carrier protein subunit [Albimonas pacifica]|uniref:Pyruvate carboxylase subunit B n=1 Tax=Albimonas pacifica TaxID=1114924 RepID=A0A1I3FC18_9RHOB|nr:acetyl-CoA carboxylase biotin carboxyl carrier protein subunit [Albimonas pacifica]SFI08694.1 pyruvate carboxylase subunit B [Albimonas pacifica]